VVCHGPGYSDYTTNEARGVCQAVEGEQARRLAASLSVPWKRRSQLARRAYVYFEDEPAGTKLRTRDGVPTHGCKHRYVAAISWIAQLCDSGPPSKPIIDAELDSRDCLLDVDTRNRYERPRERPPDVTLWVPKS
jgi:hypothetical protein